MDNTITINCVTDAFDLWEIEDRFLAEIGETPLDEDKKLRLTAAVSTGQILFFAAKHGESIVGICSVSPHFSTFACSMVGVFDDFYVEPDCRHQGIARQLAVAAQDWCRDQGYASLTVGCSDGDVAMYTALGFDLRLGTMLAADL